MGHEKPTAHHFTYLWKITPSHGVYSDRFGEILAYLIFSGLPVTKFVNANGKLCFELRTSEFGPPSHLLASAGMTDLSDIVEIYYPGLSCSNVLPETGPG
jgi:hypothetical protein